MAKKRYVGYKYENPDDVEPVFDAKGIETVRRDGIPAQAKMVERSLRQAYLVSISVHSLDAFQRILFRTQDLSQVKAYCQETWFKMHAGRASVQDFIFSKEVRLGTYRYACCFSGLMLLTRVVTRGPLRLVLQSQAKGYWRTRTMNRNMEIECLMSLLEANRVRDL